MSSLLHVTFLVVFGLALGSFVNALVWRIHEQEKIQDKKKPSKADTARLQRLSIAKGRSMCLHCGHKLSAKDLVPVLSWLSLRGKCRYCGARIPDTPVAELLAPLLLVISYIYWPWVLTGVVAWVLFVVWALCIVAFVALLLYDLRWFLLPNRIVFPLIALSLVFRSLLLAMPGSGSWSDVLLAGFWGVLVLAGLFYILFVISNEQWIGGGDVKLGIALGLLSGGPLAALLLLFFASVSGSLAALPLLTRGKSVKGVRIPFGPFLIIATIATVLFSQPILDWYTGFFEY